MSHPLAASTTRKKRAKKVPASAATKATPQQASLAKKAAPKQAASKKAAPKQAASKKPVRKKLATSPQPKPLSGHAARAGAAGHTAPDLATTLARLRAKSTAHDRQNLARFGIVAQRSLGVSMANIQAVAKSVGKSHALAAELWQSGYYEAQLLCAFVDEAEQVTPLQMDTWCDAFDNWAVCDTICFHLFDRSPHAWAKVEQWRTRPEEFVKRGAFALLACLAGHDRKASDAQFIRSLQWIEEAAGDPRNFVKKALSWALRRIGGRNAVLHRAALVVCQRLAESMDPTSRWLGKSSARELSHAKTQRRLKR